MSAERTARWRERKRAAGYRFVEGRPTLEPPRGPLPLPPHGTIARYRSRRDPCRCEECRSANAAAERERRSR